MNQPLLILALLAALSCCQSAPAQQAAAVRSTPGYSQLSISDDHGALMLLCGPDGQVTAVRDGTVLPPERVRHEDDHLRIVDEAGTTLYDIRLLPGGGLVYPYDAKLSGVNGATLWTGPSRIAARYTTSAPRKIIGVTVDSVDAVVASQLDIDPESTFVIGSVTPGMPAEKAGLQAHDVVVSIQGEHPATVEKLRDVLQDKQVGDTIKLELLRRGQRLDVDVGVAEDEQPEFYSVGNFAPEAWADFMGDGDQAAAYADLARSLSDQASHRQVELEAAQERLTELQEDFTTASEALEEARQASVSGNSAALGALNEQRARVEELRVQLAQQEARLQDSSAAMQLLDLGSGGRALVLPSNSSAFGRTAPPALPDEVDGRLRSMEERLSRLEELLQKLVESDADKK
jgi:hypothetical protein